MADIQVLVGAVFVVIIIVILAILGKIIVFELSWVEGRAFPNIKFTFSKDKENSSTTPKNQKSSETGYKIDHMYVLGHIRYGENLPSLARKELYITSLRNNINRYLYYHIDSSTEIKTRSGFTKKMDSYKRLRDFETWDGASARGLLSNMSRVDLPILPLENGDSTKLVFDAQFFGHYIELFDGVETVSHNYYVFIDEVCSKTDIILRIPNGAVSDIVRFELLNELGAQTLFEFVYESSEKGPFTVNKQYGHGWVRKHKAYTEVYWHIPTEMKQGQVCKIQWYTKRT